MASALVVSVSLSVLAVRPAAADEPADKVACARSYEAAQRLRRAQQLRASRDELRSCLRAECPATLRKDCTQWLPEVEAAIPTIVLIARGPDGRPAPDVRIRIDGEPVADQAAHAPIPLDPGPHVVRFDAPGAATLEERVTLRAGERDRRIEVTFASTAARAPGTADPDDKTAGASVPRPDADRRPAERPVPSIVYVLGAGGLAALGVGGYFQIHGMSARQDLYSCAPSCAQTEVDDARRSLWVGNVVLGVGIVALVAATVLYFTRPEAASP
jgi:hypothetical protein